jgi:hypothetical protein
LEFFFFEGVEEVSDESLRSIDPAAASELRRRQDEAAFRCFLSLSLCRAAQTQTRSIDPSKEKSGTRGVALTKRRSFERILNALVVL